MEVFAVTILAIGWVIAVGVWLVLSVHNAPKLTALQLIDAMEDADMPINIWLDEDTPCPFGWVHVDDRFTVLSIMKRAKVDGISVSGDLGDWLLDQLSAKAARGEHVPETIKVHGCDYPVRVRLETKIMHIRSMVRIGDVPHFHIDRTA